MKPEALEMLDLLREAGFDASYINPANGKVRPACSTCAAAIRGNQVVHQADCPNGIEAGKRVKATRPRN
jgi:hypothetical protein